jgi:hypothetical protein
MDEFIEEPTDSAPPALTFPRAENGRNGMERRISIGFEEEASKSSRYGQL